MCYSEEQSKISFLVNIATCYILYNYKKNTEYSYMFKILSLFLAFVGLMQLFDLILWRNQNLNISRQANINFMTTKIAMIFNNLQPIVLAYLIYTYKKSLGNLSKMFLFIYIIVISLYTIDIYNNINYTLKRNSNNQINALVWKWNNQKYSNFVYMLFLLTVTIMAYENFDYPFNNIFTAFAIVSFVLSKYQYKQKQVGRFWCKIAAWIPLIFILIDQMFIKK